MANLLSDDHKGLGCMFIFGLVFFLAGCVPGLIVGKSVWEWQQAKAWQPTYATVLFADLEQNHDGSGGPTYSVSARYEYAVAGQTYTSTRVGLHGGSDSFEDYHRQLYQRLRAAQQAGEPLTVWVNPDNPQQSLIDRDLRLGMVGFLLLFFVLFGGVGLGIIILGFWGTSRAKIGNRLEAAYTDQPWLWREDWAEGFARSEARAGFWFAVVFATVWNLISLPVLFIVPGEVLDKGNYAALLGLLFPLVGVGLIAWAVTLGMRRRRFGDSRLTLVTLPAPLGGTLEAELFAPKALPPNSRMQFTLSCIEKRTTGSGKNRKTTESIQWQDDRHVHVPPNSSPLGTLIPVQFDIPSEYPPVSKQSGNSEILWRLEALSEMPGVDYNSQFQVPVFELPGFEKRAESTATASDIGQTVLPGDPTRLGIIDQGGGHWYLPPARLKGGAVLVSFIALVFSVTTGFLWLHAPIIFPLVFGLFSFLLLWFSLELWLRRSEVKSRMGLLAWRSGLLIVGGWRELPVSNIKSLSLKNAGSINNREILKAVVIDRAGNTQVIGSQLKGRRDAEAWLAQLRRRIGLKHDPVAEGRGQHSGDSV